MLYHKHPCQQHHPPLHSRRYSPTLFDITGAFETTKASNVTETETDVLNTNAINEAVSFPRCKYNTVYRTICSPRMAKGIRTRDRSLDLVIFNKLVVLL